MSSLLRYIVVLVLSLVPATRPAAPDAGPALPVDDAQEAALLKAAGQGFQLKRTSHFLIAYDTEPPVVDELTIRLEHTYHMAYRFCEMNKIDARRPEHRLEVVFFNERSAYDRHSARMQFPSAGTCGVYFEPTNQSSFFNVINDPELRQLQADISAAQASLDNLVRTMNEIRNDRTEIEIRFGDGRRIAGTRAQVAGAVEKEIESSRRQLDTLDAKRKLYCTRINRTVIQHETAHQVLFNAGVHVRGAENPQWLVEGLACLFETPPGATGTGLAAINQLRLRDFRSAVAGESQKRRLTAGDFLEALSAGRLPPPRRLVSDGRLFQERGQLGAVHYSMAWGLAHYLQRVRGTQLAAYLKAVGSRKPGVSFSPDQELALFEEHFGPLDQEFLRQWSGYVLKLNSRAPADDWPGLSNER